MSVENNGNWIFYVNRVSACTINRLWMVHTYQFTFTIFFPFRRNFHLPFRATSLLSCAHVNAVFNKLLVAMDVMWCCVPAFFNGKHIKQHNFSDENIDWSDFVWWKNFLMKSLIWFRHKRCFLKARLKIFDEFENIFMAGLQAVNLILKWIKTA